MLKPFNMALLLIWMVGGRAHAEHPEILVKPNDRAVIQSKIDHSPWAQHAYAELKSRVDRILDHCKSDPQWASSRLFMNWQTHYTVPITAKEKWIGGEGHAPVPTPRFAGARNWATDFVAPAQLEDLKPFNDDNGKVWLFNKATGKDEWVDPGLTGRTMETVNEHIVQLAADAGFLYWLTGDERYARFGSEILWTYMNGFSYVQPPRVPENETNTRDIIGMTSFEVIHENIMIPLSEAYDFLNPYLQSQGKDVGLIQNQLKRMADRVIDGGGRDGNWNINQALMIAYAGLALEDNSEYSDHKGRPYYEDVVLNADLPHQLGLTSVMKRGYDPQTALWPEAPGYGFGTTQQIVQITSLMASDPAGQTVLKDPLLTRAILAQMQLIYPNGFSVGVGDTDNTRLNARALEFLIASARSQLDADLETRLTAALQREMDSNNYDRPGQSDIVALTQFVGELKPVPALAANLPRTYFGAPLNIVMQRDNVDPQHALAAALFGTEGGHIHANGMAIELYGTGIILGADPGRGASYWTADHAQYYSQPPAHNTVIVNGRSTYGTPRRSQIAMKPEVVEPAFGEPAVSPNISFVQGAFEYLQPPADQERTLALIRTSPTTGFYFDVFRSRAVEPANSFHDYIYHNTGQSMTLDDGHQPISLTPTQQLGSEQGDLSGYDYFKNQQFADFAGELHAIFDAKYPDGSDHNMALWMTGRNDRRVFTTQAPPDHAGRPWLPRDLLQAPMPTLLVRQNGDAWQHPFITVFEPYLGTDGPSVSEIHVVADSPDGASLAACIVKGQLRQGTGKIPFTAYLMQDDKPTQSHHVENYSFQGSFGAVILHQQEIEELYLGNGKSIGDARVSMASVAGGPVNASILHEGKQWRYSASGPVYANLIVPFEAGAGGSTQWKLVCKDSKSEHPIADAKFENQTGPSGEKSLRITCTLPAGKDCYLSIVLQ